MWFKLVNANFSANSLGKMSDLSNSWQVYLTYSGGISKVSGSGSVAKGGTWTGTFTLADGATFTSVTLSSGSASSPKSSISGSTVTITVENVASDITLALVATGGSSSGGSGGATTNYTFTINPTPTSATVTLSATGYSIVSGTGSKSITVANGTKVNWSVSADGYTTRTGNWTINGGNKTENIVLVTSATPVNLWKYSSSDMDPIMTNARYRLATGLPYKEEGDSFDDTYGTTEKIYVNGNSGTYNLNLQSGKTYRWQFIPYFEYGFLKLHNPWGGPEQTSMAGKRVFFYKADDTLIQNDNKCLDSTGMLVTVPAGAVYMRFMCWGYNAHKSGVKPLYNTLMITEGETEHSEYVPYQG